MSKPATNTFSEEVRARAVRMVSEHRSEYASQWAEPFKVPSAQPME